MGVSAFPDGDNLLNWIATIKGPNETPYEGRSYRLRMKFGLDYPFVPPSITFETPIFHPNVDVKLGVICLDILKEQWSAAYNIETILLSIQSLLGEPNPSSPLNIDAAKLWKEDQVGMYLLFLH